MVPVPALALFVILVALAGLHVFWVFGGRAGLEDVIPFADGEPLVRPGAAATVLVALLLFAAAAVSLWRGVLPHASPHWIPRCGIWVIALIFAGRAVGDFRYVGFFKKIRGTTFSRNDSLVYSPLCTAIAGLAAWLALGY
jgi:hypothetical protein